MADALDAPALRAALFAGLPPGLGALVQEATAAGAERGAPLYLVGGAVRDLLLGRPALDLDLVLPGDAVALARGLAKRHEWPPPTAHPAFGTARLRLPPELAPLPPAPPVVDFVTARRETYPAPGRLPEVTPADLAADLARRDFAINAMALPLDPADPALRDPFGGRADLAAGRIRALHAASFRDDPTRIFRAVRYAARFGFAIEAATLDWMHAALRDEMMAALSPDRVRHELERTFAEADPAPALARLDALGVLAAVDAALAWPPRLTRGLAQVPDPALRVYLLLDDLLPREHMRVVARLELNPRLARDIAQVVGVRSILPAAGPADAVRLLHRASPDALAVAAALLPPLAAAVVTRYLTTWRHVRPLLTGADLQALGIPLGPRYRRILDTLRTARLEGRVTTREDEVALVKRDA